MTHDPSEYIKGLQQILVSDKKKIAFLFGAGTSRAQKNEYSKFIPAIAEMTKMVDDEISKVKIYKEALRQIKNEIGINDYTIETLLSAIEIKLQAIGEGKLNGLNHHEFEELRTKIKKQIKDIVSIHKEIDLKNTIHIDFAEWIAKVDRKYPIEIFTTNYDYLFELGLEYHNIPYYDGFSGSYNPFFNSDSIEDLYFLPKQTKLWKIHGSLGWQYDNAKNKVLRKDSDDNDILIYPSTLKYDDSRKQPYMSLGDRLTSFLKDSDSVLIVCGYSFGDQHINERIFTALKSNDTAHIYVLYYDIIVEKGKEKDYLLIKELPLAKRALKNGKISVYGCRHAIIGCKLAKWKLKREPDKDDSINVSSYFDEDAYSDENELLKKEEKGKEIWSGEGEFKIPDFKYFIDFLQSMMLSHNIEEER